MNPTADAGGAGGCQSVGRVRRDLGGHVFGNAHASMNSHENGQFSCLVKLEEGCGLLPMVTWVEVSFPRDERRRGDGETGRLGDEGER